MDDQTKRRRVRVAVHERDVPLKTYDLVCAWCGNQATVERYPGRPPRFCSEDCAIEARRAHDRARKAAGKPAPADPAPSRRGHGRPPIYAPAVDWAWLTPDLPLTPTDAAPAAATLGSALRVALADLRRSPAVGKRAALALLDQSEQALALWRPAVVRRALLEELLRADGAPAAGRMESALVLALDAARDQTWPTEIAQLRALIEHEGRVRRQADHARLLQLVTEIADGLSRAQGGSEMAWAQISARPALHPPAATWLERGLRAFLDGPVQADAQPVDTPPAATPRPAQTVTLPTRSKASQD